MIEEVKNPIFMLAIASIVYAVAITVLAVLSLGIQAKLLKYVMGLCSDMVSMAKENVVVPTTLTTAEAKTVYINHTHDPEDGLIGICFFAAPPVLDAARVSEQASASVALIRCCRRIQSFVAALSPSGFFFAEADTATPMNRTTAPAIMTLEAVFRASARPMFSSF